MTAVVSTTYLIVRVEIARKFFFLLGIFILFFSGLVNFRSRAQMEVSSVSDNGVIMRYGERTRLLGLMESRKTHIPPSVQ